MDKLLEFVDRLCIDERLYWKLEDAEVAWERGARPAPWKVRRTNDAEWTAVATNELTAALEAIKADQTAFERQLGASILTQAVFADMVLEGAVRLFGDEVVQRSIRDTRAFLASVSEAAQSMTKAAGAGAPKGPRLRVVSRGGT